MSQRREARFCAKCGNPLSPTAKPVKNQGYFAPLLTLGAVVALVVIIVLLGGQWRSSRSIRASPISSETPTNLTPTLQPQAATPPLAPRLDQATSIPRQYPELTPSGLPEPPRGTLSIPGLNVEIPRLSDQEEIEIGRQAAREFERENPISHDAALTGQIERIGNEISTWTPRANLPYTFKVIETDDINAFALPGGFIYVTRGMTEYVRSEDELAGVIGHEIAHIALRHGAQLIENLAAAQAAIELVAAQNPDLANIYEQYGTQIAVQTAVEIGINGWGRQAELDADEYGSLYMSQAGYDIHDYLDLFERMAAQEGDVGSNDTLELLLATLPPFSERISRVEEAIVKYGLE